jgi:hypothetical protein
MYFSVTQFIWPSDGIDAASEFLCEGSAADGNAAELALWTKA